LIQIEFDEVALESMWKMYKELARKKFAKNWSSLKNEQKLRSFAKWISKDKYQEEYLARQKISRPSDPF
jgi:hypothetical protein